MKLKGNRYFCSNGSLHSEEVWHKSDVEKIIEEVKQNTQYEIINKIEKRLVGIFENRKRIHIEKRHRVRVQEIIKSIFSEIRKEESQITSKGKVE